MGLGGRTTGSICGGTFEVSAEAIAGATLSKLAREGKIEAEKAQQALAELNVDAEANDPAYACA